MKSFLFNLKRGLHVKLFFIFFSMVSFCLPAQNFIVLDSPNGGENWAGGSMQNITWKAQATGTVDLSYTIDNGATWVPIASGLHSYTGTPYAWTVPNISTNTCLVMAKLTFVSVASDMSNNYFTIGPATGLSKTNMGDPFRIFPIPALNTISIESRPGDEITSILIYNYTGELTKRISEQIIQHEHNIDVSDLAAGIYYLHINTSGKNFIKQIAILGNH